jgi:hypothetical protein
MASSHTRFSAESKATFLELLNREPTWTNRIIETFDVRGTSVHRSVSLTVSLPDLSNGPEQLLFPITQVVRGVLVDNLDVENGIGQPIPVLSRIESRQLFSELLAVVFDRVMTRSTTPQLTNVDLVLARRIRAMITALPIEPVHDAQKLYNAVFLDRVFATMSATIDRVVEDSELRQWANFFTNNAIKVGELSELTGNMRYVIKYSYDSRYDNTEARSINRLFGQRPYTFRFYTPLAFVAPSYHVRMLAPAGHYCAAEDFEVLKYVGQPKAVGRLKRIGTAIHDRIWPLDQERLSVEFIRWDAPYEKSQGLGLPYAHLYVNELSPAAPRSLVARLQFFEYPPGQQGSAFAFLFLMSTILLAVSLAFRPLVSHGENSALFLALLGAVAVWMRPGFESERLLQAPLSAKLGFLFCGAFGLASALDLILCASLQPLGDGELLVGRVVMYLLCFFSSVGTIWIGHRVIAKIRSGPV